MKKQIVNGTPHLVELFAVIRKPLLVISNSHHNLFILKNATLN